MDGLCTERTRRSSGESNSGLECSHCGCEHFRVICTPQGWGVKRICASAELVEERWRNAALLQIVWSGDPRR